MFARLLPLTTGFALLLTGCSGGADTSSNAPSFPAATSAESGATTQATPSRAKPADDAVGRYEAFLHAIGDEDITTACEIGRLSTKKLEKRGLGPCEETLRGTFQFYSPAEKRALQGATVDRSRVTEDSTGVTIPVDAVKADATFIESELREATMERRDGKWQLVRW
ncbi:hypothetical protein [Amycolatopsis sp. NPDC049868]|uniref:hypothetical protein n=1 Tax=Amycolatopsis sp. NPDC049868 TaxID=3363934 RepID=UPI003791B1DB